MRVVTSERTADSVSPGAWRAIVDSIAVGVIVLGRDGRFLLTNPAAGVILGLHPDEVTGRTTFDPRWEAQAPDGSPLPGDRHPAAIALQTGVVQRDVPLTIAHPDGRRRRLRVTAVPYRDDAGAPAGVVASFEDVTVEHEAQQALLESEVRNRILVETAADIVARGDVTGHIEWLSPSVRPLLGYAPEALVGRDMAELVHPDDLERFRVRRALIGDDGPIRADVRLRTAGGGWRWFRISANALRDPTGRIVGRVGGWQSIDDEVRERQAAERALAELREAQAIAHVGSWTFRLDGPPTWSDEMYRIHGLPIGSPLGDAAWYESRVVGDRAAALGASFARALTEGTSYEHEIEILRPDGTTRSISVRGAPIRDADGRIAGVRGTAADITDTVRRREAGRRRAAHRVDYVARAAHRLRTSLGVVSGWAELLAEQGGWLDRMALTSAHEAIGRNAARLATAIEALLAEMVEEARLASLEPVPCDIARIATGVVDDHRAEVAVLDLAMEPGEPVIGLAGEEALATALHFAVAHAIERTAGGGRIRVGAMPDPPGRVRVAVRDDGPPLEPGIDPFGAFEPTAANGGVDLGLHLVRTLAEAMGGSADARDLPGGGVEVAIRILAPEP